MFKQINDVVERAYLGGEGMVPSLQRPPDAPTGLSATGGNGQVSLSWNAMNGAYGFNVYRNGQRVNVALIINQFSFIDAAVIKGASYSYTVTAVNGTGESEQSTPATVTVMGPPLVPRNLTGTTGILRVTLQWQAPPPVSTANPPTSYSIYKGGSLLVSGITELTYTDLAVETRVTYSYVVTSVNVMGESPPTTSISVVPIPEEAPGGGDPVIPEVVGIRTRYTNGVIDRVQELDSLDAPVTQADLTWNASGFLQDVVELDELGVRHRITLNYDANGDLDPVNPVTRAVMV